MNWLLLEASIIAREPIRYTPAGVPMLNCTLRHCSEVIEVGIVRKIEMTLAAIVAGELSGWLEHCKLGYHARFAGFLAPRSRRTPILIFHIIHITQLVN